MSGGVGMCRGRRRVFGGCRQRSAGIGRGLQDFEGVGMCCASAGVGHGKRAHPHQRCLQL